MKRFINSIIRLLMRMTIFLFLVVLCFVIYMIFFSQENDITLEDTISYIQSFSDQVIDNFATNNTSTSSFNNSSEELIKIDDTYHHPISTKKKFYYEQLDNTSKMIYTSLENNIDNLKKENYTINFSTKFNTLLNQSNGQTELNRSFQTALDAFFYDHPELFYIDLTKISLVIQYTTIGPKTTYKVSLSPQNNINYLYSQFQSEAQVNTAVAIVENAKNNILQSIPNTSDYEKALKVHDILVKSLEYDSANEVNAHNLYGALVEKKVVCEGYAKAYKYILDSLDIECILVNGTATNSSGQTEAHMWNYIKLDGNWYGTDVTWDDPVIIGGGFTKDVIRHNYFAKGSNVFSKSHVVSNRISDEGNTFSIPTLSNKNFK